MYIFPTRLLRWSLLLFGRKISVEGLPVDSGPLLLLANHPNGFLDGIVIAAQLARAVYFAGNGNLIRSRIAWNVLRFFRVVPLYPASRDPYRRSANEAAIGLCRETLSRGGAVLVFVEGETKPVTELRPVTKTAFRIIGPMAEIPGTGPLTCVPVAVQYRPFRGVGKQILVRFGTSFHSDENADLPAARALAFAGTVRSQLLKCLSPGNEPPPENSPRRFRRWRWLLLPVAVTGLLLNAPLYLMAKGLVHGLVRRSGFRESALFLSLFLLYPAYWILICVSTASLTRSVPGTAFMVLMPLWARVWIIFRHP